MSEADGVNSTPRTCAPAQGISRRTALAGLAVLPAALPAAAEAATDPIFAAIDSHRKAKAASDAAWAEVERLINLANEQVGPPRIMVANMAAAGPGTECEEVVCWVDINRLVPPETYPKENALYREKLERQQEAHSAITGDTEEITEEPCAACWASVDKFAETVPTTLGGLAAMITYAAQLKQEDPDVFGDRSPLLANLATAATALIGGRA